MHLSLLPRLSCRQTVFLLLGIVGSSRSMEPGLIIDNPYQEVNWETDGRYRANFHTHTTGSDGNLNPHDVIDRYNDLNYHILALTASDRHRGVQPG